VKIIFASAHADPDCWMKPLQALIPAAEIHPWLDGGPSIDAQLAIVWNPPQDLFLRESGLKAVFNLGAGVDAVVKLPGLAEDVAVIRLEDAEATAIYFTSPLIVVALSPRGCCASASWPHSGWR